MGVGTTRTTEITPAEKTCLLTLITEINLQRVITNQLNRFWNLKVLLNLNQWMHDIDPDSGLGIIGRRITIRKGEGTRVLLSVSGSMNLHGNGRKEN